MEEALQEKTITPYSIDISRVLIDSDMLSIINCCICNHICEDPSSFSCCGVLACSKCARSNSLLCKNCEKSLPTLSKPEPLVLALFDFLRIKCKFNCGEISDYKNLSEHETFCHNNPDALLKCQTCHLNFTKSIFETHNCTKELLISLNELKNEVKNLKKKDGDDLMAKIQHSLRIHEHPMVSSKRKSGWGCDFCKMIYITGDLSYYCYQCDIDLCENCFNFTFGKELNDDIKESDMRSCSESSFICEKCKLLFQSGTIHWIYTNSDGIDVSVCLKCRFKF